MKTATRTKPTSLKNSKVIIARNSEDRMLKSEALQFPKDSLFHEIATAPRSKISTLSDGEILEKTPAQQRLIAILEQIAYQKGVRGQRGLSSLLGINQPSVRDYTNAILQEPLSMSPNSFSSIAKHRGLTETELRAFLTANESLLGDRASKTFTSKDWLKMIGSPELEPGVLVEGLKEGIQRLLDLLTERDSQIEQLKTEISEVREMNLTYYPSENSNGKAFKPHPGNQRLIDALNERQQLLGFEDEEWDEFCSNILKDWIDVWDWLQYNPLPLPNEYLTGGLPKILKKSAEELFKLRDQD